MSKRSYGVFVIPVVALLVMVTSSDANADFTIKRVVDCDRGMDVQRILDKNIFGLPMELRLVGICGRFEITQDDVSITALHKNVCPGATVDGGIFMNGARRIELRCIAVTGEEEDFGGIEAIKSEALLEDVEIVGSSGLQSTGHSTIDMIGGLIATNGTGVIVDSVSLAFFEGTHITENTDSGVDVSENSSVHFWGGSISNNDVNGVFIDTKSVVHMEGVVVLNNGRAGVAITGASFADLHGVTLADNGRLGIGSGVFMRGGSTARISGSTMTRNNAGLALLEHSFANVGNATQILDNRGRGILLRFDSGVFLESDTYVPTQGVFEAAIECDDKESSAQYDPDAVITGLIGQIECPDVEF